MKKAFISYRRQDTEGYAHSLYDRLRMNFNHRQIFMDVDDIKPGDDFVKILQSNLNDCAVLIVVIGKQWISIQNSRGERRLDNPGDFVRIEVATALERGIPVVPVLVSGAVMPTSDELPDNLKQLARRQGIVLTGVSYEHGIEQLVSSIERYFGSQRRGRQTPEAPWYKSKAFRIGWAAFFILLAIGIALDEEDTPYPPSPVDGYQTPAIGNDQSEIFQRAKVMDPPSNIREEPNGDIICQATSSSVITIIRDAEVLNGGKWYPTNFCGMDLWGVIHESQIRLLK